jgi:chaperonin GroEL
MTAKLATQDECILARAEEAGALPDGGALSSRAREEPRIGSMRFDSGYLSPYFITNPERMEVSFENAYILILEQKISSKKNLLLLLQQITNLGKPLLIIAEDLGGEVLAALVVNKLRGPLQVAAVRAPGCGDQLTGILQGIARLTGGRAITGDLDIQQKETWMSDLGQATKIVIDKHHTLVEGMGNSR